MENQNEMKEKSPTKIADLAVGDDKKAMLTFLVKARSIEEVAAKCDKSYSLAYQELIVWVAKGWVKRFKTLSGKSMYVLNENNLEV